MHHIHVMLQSLYTLCFVDSISWIQRDLSTRQYMDLPVFTTVLSVHAHLHHVLYTAHVCIVSNVIHYRQYCYQF